MKKASLAQLSDIASFAATEDQPLSITTSSLTNGGSQILRSVGHAAHGTVTLNKGKVVFQPDQDFNGIATFDYTLVDNHGVATVHTATIDVAPVADAPALSVAAALSAPGDAITKQGGEFLVNTTTAGGQFFSSIATFADGGFVMAWTDTSYSANDFSNAQVKAQIFDASGHKVGSEFRVNTTTALEQRRPKVSVLSNGDFVVAWEDESGKGGDASGGAIKAQLYHGNGSKVGGEFLVNTTTQGTQNEHAITALANGRFVVTWTDTSGVGGDSSGSAIKAQLFNANGSKAGGEFLVNTITSSFQDEPSVASLKNGGFVVSWQDNSGLNGDGTRGGSIKAQMFDANGVKVGGELLVDTNGINFANESPSIVGLSNGGFVVTWEASANFGPDTDDSAMKVQIFDASGRKVGGEIVANTSATEYQKTPVVTELSNGFIVIVWEDHSEENGDTTGTSIKAQVLDANGNRVGGEFLVNTSTAGDQQFPSVAALANGSFIISWSDGSGAGGDTSGFGVKSQIFSVGSAGPSVITDEILSGGSVAENVAIGTVVGTVQGVDSQPGAVLTYSLTNNAGGRFAIDANTGIITVANGTLLDFEAATTHGIAVQVRDQTGASFTKTFNLNVTNVNETPTNETLTGGSVVGSSANGTVVGTVTGADPDAGSVLRYALIDNAGGAFAINANTGIITVADSTKIDFAAGTSRGINVRVTDQGGLSFDKTFNIAVTDPGKQFVAANELKTGNEDNSLVVSAASLIADATNLSGTALTVSSVGNATHGTVSMVNGNIAFVPVAGFSGIAKYDYTLRDASGRTSTATVTVNVAPVADAPTLSVVQESNGPAGINRVGGEVLINTTLAGGQFQSSMAAYADGRYVIAWSDTSYTGSNFTQVRAQRFNADGSKAGAEFRVNVAVDGHQRAPQVSILANGNFVVAWESESNADGTGADGSEGAVKARVFRADGTPVTGGFLVHTSTQGTQEHASITALRNGDFVVAWADHGDGDGNGAAVKARLFSADGTAKSGELQINTLTTADQDSVSIATLKGGGFVATWRDNSFLRGDETRSGSIIAQRFDDAGNKVGGEVLVDTRGINFVNESPTVTGLSNGGFVVVWEASANTGPDTNDSSIDVQFFDASGNKVGPMLVANTATDNYQKFPVVTELDNGFVVVVWTDNSTVGDAEPASIKMQVYDPNGARVGGEILVNTTTEEYQQFPSVVALPGGRVMVSWSDQSGHLDPQDDGIVNQIFSIGNT
ncbi:MAG: tandem-95 repeat protein, partial [Bradyrhizobium sp.]